MMHGSPVLLAWFRPTLHSVRVVGPAEVVVTDFPVRLHLPGVSRS